LIGAFASGCSNNNDKTYVQDRTKQTKKEVNEQSSESYEKLEQSFSKDMAAVTLGNAEQQKMTVYENQQYGFKISLPKSWDNYTVIKGKWEAFSINDTQKVTETGGTIYIRHPKWTSENQRQDIPIMIFNIEQWDLLQQDKIHIGAAPIGPSELGRNSKYVFALPARYNYAFPTGYEEVEDIINNNSFSILEMN
jgi:hypothetical protein